jgi:hypothetical protein
MVGYQMTWAATLKTVEVSNFFKEVPAIIRKFKITLPLNIAVLVRLSIFGLTVRQTTDSPSEGRYDCDDLNGDACRLESELHRGYRPDGTSHCRSHIVS